MCRNNNIWPHIIILLILAIVTVCGHAALANRHAMERRTLNQEAGQRRERELSAFWNSLRFVETEGDWIEQMFARIIWPTTGLNELQSAKLKRRFARTLAYLRTPDLATYGSLKTNGLRWDFSLRNSITNEYGSVLGEVHQPVEVTAKLWQALTPPTPAQPRPRLTAICLTNVVIVTSQTNSRITIVNGPTRKGLTALRVAPEPGFNYAPKHTVTEGGGPDELYAHVSF
jgi:hypothetical protein